MLALKGGELALAGEGKLQLGPAAVILWCLCRNLGSTLAAVDTG